MLCLLTAREKLRHSQTGSPVNYSAVRVYRERRRFLEHMSV